MKIGKKRSGKAICITTSYTLKEIFVSAFLNFTHDYSILQDHIVLQKLPSPTKQQGKYPPPKKVKDFLISVIQTIN